MKPKVLLLALLAQFLTLSASAYDAEIDGIYYNFSGDKATVTHGYYSSENYAGSVVIPKTVSNYGVTYSVTSIGESAFYNCSGLTSITIPNSVTSIGRDAFLKCSGLKSVHITDLAAWCNISFYSDIDMGGPFSSFSCDSNPLTYAQHLYLDSEEIKNLVIPSSVTSISDGAFYGSTALTSVIIPNEVTKIGNSAFSDCSNLTSVTIQGSGTSVDKFAFRNCSSLTSITILGSVARIGEQAFNGCFSLTSVHITDLAAWCKTSFQGSPSYSHQANPLIFAHHLYLNGEEIKDLVIPNGVTSIGQAFDGCSSLTSVTIPNSVTSIEQYAFYDCTGLTSVTIPNSVTSIGGQAFYNCSSLTSITIQGRIARIGERAFYGCSSLTSVHITDLAAWCNTYFVSTWGSSFKGCEANPLFYAHHLYLNGEEIIDLVIPNGVTSIKQYAFYDCSSLTSVTIPNSVTSIGDYAFDGCSSLAKITIGRGVQDIGNGSFSNCSDLLDIFCSARNVPSTGNYVFDNSFIEDVTLHVPLASMQTYRTTAPWSGFGRIVSIEGGEPEVKTCAKPTICYANGKLTFYCETEGAVCQSTITDTDIQSYSGNEVQLSVTYNISVYAAKDGYENSEIATATLCWIDVEPQTEGIDDAVAEVKALPVLIQTQSSTIIVQGVTEGTNVSVYSVNGVFQGSAIADEGIAILNTSLRPDSVAVVKIGEKTVKVMIK